MKQLLLILIFFPLFAQAQIISTIAGDGVAGFNDDGVLATYSELYWPSDVKTDTFGNVYIADFKNNRIRMVNSAGIISTIVGTGTAGYSGDGGPAVSAELNQPSAIAFDGSGNLYIADEYNNRIRVVNPSGIITTYAGTGTAGFTGNGGEATAAELDFPGGVATDLHGNVYISDVSNDRIRKVGPSGIITIFAGNGAAGYTGDGGMADTTELNTPTGMIVDGAGNLYFSDLYNSRVREINTSGIISTIAGNGAAGYSGDGAAATAAGLDLPGGLALDAAGNIYIADLSNNRVRRVSAAGIIATVAGDGTFGYSGDGGPAGSAQLYHPQGVAIDSGGNIYIADYLNDRIRMVTASTGVNNVQMGEYANVQIFPNPANAQLTITSTQTITNITITNLVGQTVPIAIGTHEYNTPKVQVDVSTLPGGIYFVKVNNTDVRKFVKE